MALLVGSVILCCAPALAQKPHQYQFQNSLKDDWSGTTLRPVGGKLGADRFTFGFNQGLILNDLAADDYTMDMSFVFTSWGTRRWARIYDLSSSQRDLGFYVLDQSTYQFYPNTPIPGYPGLNVLQRLTVVRQANQTTQIYRDGKLLATQLDRGNSLSNKLGGSDLRYFIDDVAVPNEVAAGYITWLRIFDRALPPDEIPIIKPPCKPNPVSKGDATGASSIQTTPSAQAKNGMQLYFSFAHTKGWWGELTANPIDPTTGSFVGVSWSAGCLLTGGSCTPDDLSPTPFPKSRSILTWDAQNQKGVPFRWASLTPSMQALLETSIRLDYLRGTRTQEAAYGGALRDRTSLLGDIVDSGPVVLSQPAENYDQGFQDPLHPQQVATEGTSYSNFKSAQAQRQSVVYVGANDGFLHGFRAGLFDAASGNSLSTPSAPNDGLELLAYMPASVLKTIHNRTSAFYDFSAPTYWHNTYVDAVPFTGDVYYAGQWHTLLASTLGPGSEALGPAGGGSVGKGNLFLLDVTDPTKFKEANAASLTLGEWTSDTLQCVNDAHCGDHFGPVYGTPVIQRMHNGQWAVIFGNGTFSKTQKAGIFIMLLDPQGKNPTFRYLDSGSTAPNNGIFYVTPISLLKNNIADYLYAGDLAGNVWRFDVTSDSPADWKVSSPGPLFTAAPGQTISTAVLVSLQGTASTPRVVLNFGTGRQTTATQLTYPQYATGQQSLYGVWDGNMASWNATNAPQKFQGNDAVRTLQPTDLAQRLIDTSNSNSSIRTMVPGPTVCWPGECTGPTLQYGWKIDFPASPTGTMEQVIFNPTIYRDALFFNTSIPQPLKTSSANASTTCDAGVFTALINGYTMAIDPFTGLPKSTTTLVGLDKNLAGLSTGGLGTPIIRKVGDKYFLYQKALGSGNTESLQNIEVRFPVPPVPINVPSKNTVKRLTWRELR